MAHPPSKPRASLLSLPPEVRLMIYKIVFTVTIPFRTQSEQHLTEQTGYPMACKLASLLLTCRLFYTEGLDMYWNSLGLEFPSGHSLHVLTNWPRVRRVLIRARHIKQVKLHRIGRRAYSTTMRWYEFFDWPILRSISFDDEDPSILYCKELETLPSFDDHMIMSRTFPGTWPQQPQSPSALAICTALGLPGSAFESIGLEIRVSVLVMFPLRESTLLSDVDQSYDAYAMGFKINIKARKVEDDLDKARDLVQRQRHLTEMKVATRAEFQQHIRKVKEERRQEQLGREHKDSSRKSIDHR